MKKVGGKKAGLAGENGCWKHERNGKLGKLVANVGTKWLRGTKNEFEASK